MAETISAFDFIARKPAEDVPPVCVLFGDEPWLKHEALERLRSAVLDSDQGDLSFTSYAGDSVELRDVLDELATVSMFGGGKRMVVVDEADKFVATNREKLEDFCERPRASAVLVLCVASWPATTRLYKKVAQIGWQINCNLPKQKWGDGVDEEPVLRWLSARAYRQHQTKLAENAADLLLEIVGPQLGRLDQELTKLSLLASRATAGTQEPAARGGSAQQSASGAQESTRGSSAEKIITRELVEQAVSGWRAKTAWAMIEAALEGNARDALVQLDRLLLAGEEPIALLAMMSGSLRRTAAASRIVELAEAERRRLTLPQALQEAGVPPKRFLLDKAERQLRQIGRKRARHVFGWLLEADLALKSTNSSGEQRGWFWKS